jgi:UDP-N-acetyl-D-glucosamine dehydrogenase
MIMQEFKKIAVIGLGYVGLPLSMEMLNSGFSVVGIDINPDHVRRLRSFCSSIEGVSAFELRHFQEKNQFLVTDDASEIANCDVVILTVPTPLNSQHKPDLSVLIQAAETVARNVARNTLIINESTSYPGTLREIIYPIFQEHSLLELENLQFACSPERVDPGNKTFTFKNTPRVVAGLSDKAASLVKEFYSNFVDTVILVESPEVAELSKLIENSYRLINISFINELKEYCHVKGIKLTESIYAASTKPYGFAPFYPSAGVGGHCIPVDPVYLIENARQLGIELTTLVTAEQANIHQSSKLIQFCRQVIGEIADKRILIEGIAYKANIADIRESAAIRIFENLQLEGAKVEWRDSAVSNWLFPQTTSNPEDFDLVIVCTLHDVSDLSSLIDIDTPVIDLTHRLPRAKNVIHF